MNENEVKFSSLNLSVELLKAIEEMGFENATPIQAQTIPVIMQGNDIIGQAQTGTGKTAAFGIPLLEMLTPGERKISALVVCPTRELAVQITAELQKMAKYKKGVNVTAIYGGESISRQISAIKRGTQIIVGTPGRIMDHLERGTISFSDVKMVVLDEADEMLNMGFREDIESILSHVPKTKQTALFSATMAKPILEISRKFLTNPQHIKAVQQNMTASTIDHCYFEIGGVPKEKIIATLIGVHNMSLTLVFSNTKKQVDEIVDRLKEMGFKAEGLHGDLSQQQRNLVLQRFKKTYTNILVATDVAARGLDINNVDAVINYDLPFEAEYYVHRIGRTGRAGKSGMAFSFLEGKRDIFRLRAIEAYIKTRIEKRKMPTVKDLFNISVDRLKAQITAMPADADMFIYEKAIAELCIEGLSIDQIAARLMKSILGVPDTTPERAERPEREGRYEGRGDRRERGGEGRGDRREDRGDRVGRSGRSERYSSNTTKVRMHIGLGSRDRVRPGDIVGALAGECNINGDTIGIIDIYDTHSFVEIAEMDVDRVLEGMRGNTIKGKRVSMRIAHN